MGHEQPQIIRQISGLSAISDRYDAILCDIWGVLHNGVASFAAASEALVSFRRRGGAVVLISNAPRPSPPIQGQVLKLGVSPEAFDSVVTSGDVTIGLMQGQAGDRNPPHRAAARLEPPRRRGEGKRLAAASRSPRRRPICALHRPSKRRAGNAGGLRGRTSDDVEPRLDDDLRQSGHRDPPRRHAHLLRGSARASI